MVAKLMAVCMALFLVGGAAQAAGYSVAAPAAAVELTDTPADIIVPVEPVLLPLIRHGLTIEMPPITQLITYTFAPRMDRPPRN
ncbi:MAG TPA: hypothetical protein VFQ65_05865 [Kofleriaceae bacterium]|nr:hypothetical protein [Kofleriaceae bacterium]